MASNALGMQGNAAAGGAWSSGLCNCFDDVGGCCLTFFCPCVTFGRIAGIVDQGATSCCVSGSLYMLLSAVTGLGCLYSCLYRSRLRSQYGLTETPCADCCVHFCCEACALCQEYRELKSRGFDMSAGWQENMERMGKQAPPPPHRSRTRGCRASSDDSKLKYIYIRAARVPDAHVPAYLAVHVNCVNLPTSTSTSNLALRFLLQATIAI